jgi:hypothetical protein
MGKPTVGFISVCVLAVMGCATPETPAPTTSQEYGGAATAVLLEKAVHFTSAEETDVLLAAGTYRVEQAAGTSIRLVMEASPTTHEIAATSFTHEESLTAPLAFVAREEQQEMAVHLLLLLPGGQGLDATRKTDGVQTRGTDGISRLIAVTQTKSVNANDEARSAADKQRTLVMKQQRLRSAQQNIEDMQRTTGPFESQLILKRCDYCKLLNKMRK